MLDLFDLGDKDQEVFKGAYRKVMLKALEPGGRLKGPYVDTTITSKCARSSNFEFAYTRKDDRFEEVMAYYHIDTLQRYIQSLGFKDGAEAILMAEKNLYGGKKNKSMTKIFKDRGIL